MNARQERFCQEYLIDLNGTQAAIRAGYSFKTAKVIGCNLLTKINIQDKIQKLKQARSNKTEISAEYVLTGLKQVADRCRQDDKFDSSGANKSLELLGKHLGLFTEKHELTGDLKIRVDFSDD